MVRLKADTTNAKCKIQNAKWHSEFCSSQVSRSVIPTRKTRHRRGAAARERRDRDKVAGGGEAGLKRGPFGGCPTASLTCQAFTTATAAARTTAWKRTRTRG